MKNTLGGLQILCEQFWKGSSQLHVYGIEPQCVGRLSRNQNLGTAVDTLRSIFFFFLLFYYRSREASPGGWGSQSFKTTGTWRWLNWQPFPLAAFTLKKHKWYSFLMESTAGLQGLSQWKIPFTSSEIERTPLHVLIGKEHVCCMFPTELNLWQFPTATWLCVEYFAAFLNSA